MRPSYVSRTAANGVFSREIIDESDVYVDVHKAIRRAHPGPHVRAQWRDLMVKDMAIKDDVLDDLVEEELEGTYDPSRQSKRTSSLSGSTEAPALSQSPRMTTTLLLRRASADHNGKTVHTTVPVKTNLEDMRDHLKNLGPSNPASNPKSTRVSAVKIKPGTAATPILQPISGSMEAITEDSESIVDERTGLLGPQLTAKDGVQALHHSYYGSPNTVIGHSHKSTVVTTDGSRSPGKEGSISRSRQATSSSEDNISPSESGGIEPTVRRRGHVRSGSITENIVEAGGIRKVVLEANSSSGSEGDETDQIRTPGTISDGDRSSSGRKKNRRKMRRSKS